VKKKKPQVFKIPMTNCKKRFAMLDKVDYEKCKKFKWRINHRGYAWSWKVGLMHRFILRDKLSENKDLTVHHKRGKLNNRRKYLQVLTEEEHKKLHENDRKSA